MDSYSRIIDVDELFNDTSVSSVSSEDEEQLNPFDLTDAQLRLLCTTDCYVDLTKRNLYYACEQAIVRGFEKNNQQFEPHIHSKIVLKQLKKNFHKYYTQHYIKWEEKHRKLELLRQRERQLNAIKFLFQMFQNEEYIGYCNSSTEEDEDDSQVSSQTVIRKATNPETSEPEINKENIENDNQKNYDDSLDSFLDNSIALNQNISKPIDPLTEESDLSYSQFNHDFEYYAVVHDKQVTSTQT